MTVGGAGRCRAACEPESWWRIGGQAPADTLVWSPSTAVYSPSDLSCGRRPHPAWRQQRKPPPTPGKRVGVVATLPDHDRSGMRVITCMSRVDRGVDSHPVYGLSVPTRAAIQYWRRATSSRCWCGAVSRAVCPMMVAWIGSPARRLTDRRAAPGSGLPGTRPWAGHALDRPDADTATAANRPAGGSGRRRVVSISSEYLRQLCLARPRRGHEVVQQVSRHRPAPESRQLDDGGQGILLGLRHA